MLRFNNSANSHRKIGLAIGIFLALACVSAAYAAKYGFITFTGVVARTYSTNVRFTNARFPGLIRDGESVDISDDGHSINVVAQLMQPGDSRAIEFQIENTGTQPVRFLDITTTQDALDLTGLNITWPDETAILSNDSSLTNYILVPMTTSSVFTLYISWDATATNVPSGQWRYFSFVVDYQNAMIPVAQTPPTKRELL